MKYRYVIWDWNGTLLDDLDASIRAGNDMLEMYGKPQLDLETYYSYIDTPIYKFYERIFDFNVVPMEVIKPLFRELYEKRECEIGIADGAMQVIETLCRSGVKQYILSAANVDDLMKYAKKYNVCGCFEKIDAAYDRDAGSKTERAVRLVESENIDPTECVLIGDTLHDYETAKTIGADCILYSKGHTGEATLKNTGCVVCGSFEEIIRNINEAV